MSCNLGILSLMRPLGTYTSPYLPFMPIFTFVIPNRISRRNHDLLASILTILFLYLFRTGIIIAIAIVLVYYPTIRGFITYPHMYVLNIPLLMGLNAGATFRNLYFYTLALFSAMFVAGACYTIVGRSSVLLPLVMCISIWIGLLFLGPGPNVMQMKIYVGYVALFIISAYRAKGDWSYIRDLATNYTVCYIPVMIAILFPTPLTASNNTRIASHRAMLNISRLFEVLNEGFACQVIAEREGYGVEDDDEDEDVLEAGGRRSAQAREREEGETDQVEKDPLLLGNTRNPEKKPSGNCNAASHPRKSDRRAPISTEFPPPAFTDVSVVEAELLIGKIEAILVEISSQIIDLKWESIVYRAITKVLCFCRSESGRNKGYVSMDYELFNLDGIYNHDINPNILPNPDAANCAAASANPNTNTNPQTRTRTRILTRTRTRILTRTLTVTRTLTLTLTLPLTFPPTPISTQIPTPAPTPPNPSAQYTTLTDPTTPSLPSPPPAIAGWPRTPLSPRARSWMRSRR